MQTVIPFPTRYDPVPRRITRPMGEDEFAELDANGVWARRQNLAGATILHFPAAVAVRGPDGTCMLIAEHGFDISI